MKTLLAVFLGVVLVSGFAFAESEIVLNFDQDMFKGWTVQTRSATPTWDVSSNSESGMPEVFELGVAYPNPFNPSTKFVVSLPDAADLNLAVYNVLGQQIEIIADQRMEAGRHAFTFDGRNLASGVYFIQAVVPGELNEMQKVFLMK